ncbi:MAG: cytochrome c-type biogenesis protein [Methylotenera sp.]
MRMLLKIWLAFILILSTAAYSADKGADPEFEARLKHLSNELRCLVCQNTTLADSDAPLAQDLRNEVRKLMEQGKTDEEVVAYLVARYGDFVTFRPPVKASTALLWFGPFAMLIIGLITLVVVLKKRAKLLEAEDNEPS